MTKEEAQSLRARVQEALPELAVFILDRGFGIGYVVTVEQDARALLGAVRQEKV